MHIIIKKGVCVNTTKTTCLSVFFTWFFAVAFFAVFSSPSPAFAQDAPSSQRPKPQLVEIVLNEETNDPEALEIAKKLDPDFFLIDKEYLDGSPEAVFSARFIPLSPNEPKRFIAVTVSESLYYCTTYGCPYYFYEQRGDNKWALTLSSQAHTFYYDKNSNSPHTLISQTQESAIQITDVWLWNGMRYTPAIKRN